MDPGIGHIRLDDDPLRRRVAEQERHDGIDHGLAEAVNRRGRRVSRRDQKVHATVAGLDRIVLADRIVARVVALDQKRRLVIVQADERLGAVALFHLAVERGDLISGIAVHAPEAGGFPADPVEHGVDVAAEIERSQGEGADARPVAMKAQVGRIEAAGRCGVCRVVCRGGCLGVGQSSLR